MLSSVASLARIMHTSSFDGDHQWLAALPSAPTRVW
jgi:hypothetical protein